METGITGETVLQPTEMAGAVDYQDAFIGRL